MTMKGWPCFSRSRHTIPINRPRAQKLVFRFCSQQIIIFTLVHFGEYSLHPIPIRLLLNQLIIKPGELGQVIDLNSFDT